MAKQMAKRMKKEDGKANDKADDKANDKEDDKEDDKADDEGCRTQYNPIHNSQYIFPSSKRSEYVKSIMLLGK